MFYVSCRCGSRDVHHYRYTKNNTLNQYCGNCKVNMTQVAVSRARQTRKMHSKRTKVVKKAQSPIIGIGMVIWAVLTLGYFVGNGVYTAYAQMVAPIEYVATDTPKIILSQIHSESLQVESETLVQKIDRYADDANIARWKLHALIQCESQYDVKAKNVSKRESSHGIVQINLRAHNITLEQAENPDFALSFLIKNWYNRHNLWVTCSAGT